jgi:hypothetical protein
MGKSVAARTVMTMTGPVVYEDGEPAGEISWEPVPGAAGYVVVKNGAKPAAKTEVWVKTDEGMKPIGYVTHTVPTHFFHHEQPLLVLGRPGTEDVNQITWLGDDDCHPGYQAIYLEHRTSTDSHGVTTRYLLANPVDREDLFDRDDFIPL